LQQIGEKKYRQELVDYGVEEVLEIGLAFAGKEVLIRERKV